MTPMSQPARAGPAKFAADWLVSSRAFAPSSCSSSTRRGTADWYAVSNSAVAPLTTRATSTSCPRDKSERACQGDCRERRRAQEVHGEEHRAPGDAVDQRRAEDSDERIAGERARGEHAHVERCGMKLEDRQRWEREGGELRANGTYAFAEPQSIEVAAEPDPGARAFHHTCERGGSDEHSMRSARASGRHPREKRAAA